MLSQANLYECINQLICIPCKCKVVTLVCCLQGAYLPPAGRHHDGYCQLHADVETGSAEFWVLLPAGADVREGTVDGRQWYGSDCSNVSIVCTSNNCFVHLALPVQILCDLCPLYMCWNNCSDLNRMFRYVTWIFVSDVTLNVYIYTTPRPFLK